MKKYRYSVIDWHIFDSDVKSSEGFYIREILDVSSFEYENSKLTP